MLVCIRVPPKIHDHFLSDVFTYHTARNMRRLSVCFVFALVGPCAVCSKSALFISLRVFHGVFQGGVSRQISSLCLLCAYGSMAMIHDVYNVVPVSRDVLEYEVCFTVRERTLNRNENSDAVTRPGFARSSDSFFVYYTRIS